MRSNIADFAITVRSIALLAVAAGISLTPSRATSAVPLNFGKGHLAVTDFGADNTGTTDARAGIQMAMNSCDSTAGCDVYFPAGTYQLNTPPPGSTSVLTVPAGVPITLSGAGQGSSVLQPSGAAASGTYDILSVGTGSTGFSMHDLGMTFAAIPLSGAAVRIPSASAVSLLNLRIVGAYDDIALGQVGATMAQTLYTNIRGVNALNTKHCFLRLDGGVSDTYVRGSYALANAVTGSQIICSPSTQGLGFFGVQGLYLSNSTFSGFTRGLSFAANMTQFSDLHFLYVTWTSSTAMAPGIIYVVSLVRNLTANLVVSC
jgi:Pectate lyase superfamily protein